ncbi:hypothetical protein O7626_04740 [Micromonospora sp. WMMD1102]|uniref:hypothetical protein n=1 Tax=Micromonospora sp. WMMD1102 TaxID=3016105 RepID=UPI0024155BDF|nr:hypothetical protein [Micromonospora sp. WMMD1102]MDG4785246.1 hypothetical protein [Micromonospora sp. WMMD1102]
MGVLYDYFRAPGDDAVRALMAATGGCSPDPTAHPWTDVLALKGLDPMVVLGRLVGFVLEEPWQPDLVPADLVWPAPEQTDGGDRDGPWVLTVGERARDALAGVTAERVPGLAVQWIGIEELRDFGPDLEMAESVLTDLAGLARAARSEGDSLYCWCCL